MKSLRQSLGLENDGPNVEINFNIETDDVGAPLDNSESVEAKKVEAIETEAEAEQNEAEVQELEEAQEALESYKQIAKKYLSEGGISQETLDIFRVGAYHLTKNPIFKDSVGLENRNSPVGNALMIVDSMECLIPEYKAISLEAKEGFFSKIKHAIDSIVNLEEAVMKRAKAVKELSKAAKNEKSDNKTISVNSLRGLKLDYICDKERSEPELLKECDKVLKLLKALNLPSDGKYDPTKPTDMILSFKDSDWERKDGIKTYTFFNAKATKTNVLVLKKEKKNKDIKHFPVLKSSTVLKVLDNVEKMHSEGKRLEAINREFQQIFELREHSQTTEVKSGGGVTTATRKDGEIYVQMEATIMFFFYCYSYRLHIMDELTNYCFASISNRELD